MKRYVLDTSALFTLRDNERGSERVAELLYQSQCGEAICFASFMTQMELFYRVWRDEGERAGRLALEQCRALPITWVEQDQALLEKAAELKATLSISLAEAWVGATAILQGAALIHKDPEFEMLDCQQEILPDR